MFRRSFLIAFAFAAVLPCMTQAQGIVPRAAVVKPIHFKLDREIHRDDVVRLKFNDGLHVRVENGHFVDHGTGSLPLNHPIHALLATTRIRRSFDVDDAQLLQWQTTARNNLGRAIADHRLCFNLYLDSEEDAEALIDALNGMTEVEYAMPMLRPVPNPSLVAPDFQPMQDYLGAPTVGTGAQAAWTNTNITGVGPTGAGVNICDVEYNWNFNHVDLPTYTLVGPSLVDPFNSTNHGTAVLGEMAGLDNGTGVTGMSYDSTFYAAAANTAAGYSVANGIANSLTVLGAGDICLIEQQTFGPNNSNFVPCEWDLPVYNTIVMAVGNGVIVIEAAGNGGENLDGPSYSTGNFGHYPFQLANDSGAIIIGAGAAQGGSSTNHSRLGFSCYGATVDVQGQGERVVTTGYGGLYSAGGGDELFTSTFGGTSSSSPIVASSAALLQSLYKLIHNAPMTPAQMKALLVSTGSPQVSGTHPASQNIGPFPNITAAINQMIVNASVATIASLTPPSVPEGSPMTTLAVHGGNYDPGTTVYFDGIPLPTTFVDAQNVTATIPAILLQLSSPHEITVDNTLGFISAPRPFEVLGPTLGAAGNGRDVLKINGSLGGVDRRVDIPVYQPIEIRVEQPASNPNPAPFIIYGQVGVPATNASFTYAPFVAGDMIVTPCDADPLNPFLFVMFTTLPPGPCGGMLVGPTPFSFGTNTGAPVHIRMTLQGAIEASPGAWEFTNGVILNTY